MGTWNFRVFPNALNPKTDTLWQREVSEDKFISFLTTLSAPRAACRVSGFGGLGVSGLSETSPLIKGLCNTQDENNARISTHRNSS